MGEKNQEISDRRFGTYYTTDILHSNDSYSNPIAGIEKRGYAPLFCIRSDLLIQIMKEFSIRYLYNLTNLCKNHSLCVIYPYGNPI